MMSSFIDRFWGKKSSTPAQSAKDRLKFVLVADRTTLAPEELNQMQSEILEVIRKYCRIREEDVELKFEQRERESFLVADIPLSAGRSGEPGGRVRIETNFFSAEESESPTTAPTTKIAVNVEPAAAITAIAPPAEVVTEDIPEASAPTLDIPDVVDEEDTVAFEGIIEFKRESGDAEKVKPDDKKDKE
jgi:cell division topological specificity factor